MQEGERLSLEAFPILGQAPALAEPSEDALHDPAPGQHDEALGPIRTLDDLDGDPGGRGRQRPAKLQALVAAVRVERQEEREQAEQARHDERAVVSVIDVGGVHDRLYQEALRVDEDGALPALDFLARVIAGGLIVAPPFPCSSRSDFQ